MTYELFFAKHALKEWKKLSVPLQQQFKNKLAEVCKNPHVPKNKLHSRDLKNCYKIKLRDAGYRLIYHVKDKEVIVEVIAVGKRDKDQAYELASRRLQ